MVSGKGKQANSTSQSFYQSYPETNPDFEQELPLQKVSRRVKKNVRKSLCNRNLLWNTVKSSFPVLKWLPQYKWRSWLLDDVIAGLTAAVMHVPQGMAYGMLAEVPPVNGLYTSFFPGIFYFALASSKVVSVGTFAIASLMTSGIIESYQEQIEEYYLEVGSLNESSFQVPGLTNNNGLVEIGNAQEFYNYYAVQSAMAISFCAGVFMAILGILKFGFLSNYLSNELIGGFTSGAAFHIAASQLVHVLGYRDFKKSSGALGLIMNIKNLIINLGNTNYGALVVSVICMSVLYVVKTYVNANKKILAKIKIPIPIELILIVIVTAVSYLANLSGDPINVPIVGSVPTGLPAPQLPNFELIRLMFPQTILLSAVLFSITVSLARLLSINSEDELDSSAELRALGGCNVISCFFGCIPSSGALARSMVVSNAGAKSQLNSLVSSSLLMIILLWVSPLLEPLPTAVLASIIIVALKRLFFQLGDVCRLAKVSLIDASIWLVTFFATIFIDVATGLLIGVVYSVLTVLIRTQYPYVSLLGRVPDTEFFRSTAVSDDLKLYNGIRIVHIESPLYFANTDYATQRILKLSGLKKPKRKNSESKDEADNSPVSHIIFDCSSINFLDSSGVKLFLFIMKIARQNDKKVFFASCKLNFREMLSLSSFFENEPDARFFGTVDSAVQTALNESKEVEKDNENNNNIPTANDERTVSVLKFE